MNKRRCIALLVCLNVALLCGIVLSTTSPTAAFAQGTGLAGNYMTVTGEVRDQYDALYLIDMRPRVLHAFYFDIGTKRLRYADSRDLERDFRNNKD